MNTIITVGCEVAVTAVLKSFFNRNDYLVSKADNAEEVFSIVKTSNPSMILYDIQNLGPKELEKIHEGNKDQYVPILLLTDYGSIGVVVDAMKFGVEDYITKPFKLQNLLNLIEKSEAKRNITKVERQKEIIPHFGTIVGESPEILQVCSMVKRVAPSDATVLIQGESGTGKELVARAIHDSSNRKDQPFLPLNCAAIPEQLLESELFGHVKGAFTGANDKRDGLFISANNGTVFLDEINSMDLNLQSKLLRVLQERKVKRVGDDKSVSVNVRIIAACNESLIEKKNSGQFREDLFYRICIVPIDLPPLRRRSLDIPLLIEFFLQLESEKQSRKLTISDNALQGFVKYSWPGNIRELQNAIACATVLSTSGHLTKEDLPSHIAELITHEDAQLSGGLPLTKGGKLMKLKDYVRYKEQEYIRLVIEENKGNRSKAAKLLGISRASLYRKLEECSD